MRCLAAKIASMGQMLKQWAKNSEASTGQRPGIPTESAGQLTTLERVNRRPRQANAILPRAGVCPAQAVLDRDNAIEHNPRN